MVIQGAPDHVVNVVQLANQAIQAPGVTLENEVYKAHKDLLELMVAQEQLVLMVIQVPRVGLVSLDHVVLVVIQVMMVLMVTQDVMVGSSTELYMYVSLSVYFGLSRFSLAFEGFSLGTQLSYFTYRTNP